MKQAAATAAIPARGAYHGTLRFAAGVTLAMVISEVMGWRPSFLAPVICAVLLANLPSRPPAKATLGLIAIMAAASLLTFAAASLLRAMPWVLYGLIALGMFLSFHAMLSGRPRLPALVLLICLATVPIVVLIAPAFAGTFPMVLIRGIAVALLAIHIVFVLWPVPLPATPASTILLDARTALATALVSTAIVVPLMLVYLLYGLVDALPVLIGTVMLVVNFDLQRTRMHALAMIVGNFSGGLLGLGVHALLLTTPSLLFLALLLFLMLLWLGQRIVAGGAMAGLALLVCNTMLIILSSAIASGPGSITLWFTRVMQFVIAGGFAVGMMSLIWHRAAPSPTRIAPVSHG